MKVYERLADAFIAEGTKHVFGMMGDGNMYWMNALIDRGLEPIEVRHEGVGLGMADGYARHTHGPAVATATCGPGVTQLATALVTAARAESPVVAFVGEHPASDQDYHQRLNQAESAVGFPHRCHAAHQQLPDKLLGRPLRSTLTQRGMAELPGAEMPKGVGTAASRPLLL